MVSTRTSLHPVSGLLVLVALTLVFSAALGGAGPAAAAAASERPAAEAAKRSPYPPARLWYRVNARFKGTVENGDPSGHPRLEFDSSWELTSRTAVRLTLLCVNRRIEPDAPFQFKPRVRGKKRRAGGCLPGTKREPRPNLAPTLRFAAGADGEIGEWKMLGTDQNEDCGQVNWTRTLDGPQALNGTIQSANSAIEGIAITAGPSGQPGPVAFRKPALECVSATTGNPYSVPAVENTLGFRDLDLFGIESYVGGELVSERLRVAPGRFGRAFSVRASLNQPEDHNRALPPAGPYYQDPFAAKSYQWKVRFKPCPGGGRKAKRC